MEKAIADLKTIEEKHMKLITERLEEVANADSYFSPDEKLVIKRLRTELN
jgi:hypothetical protein